MKKDLRILTSFWFTVCLIVLLLNDFVLKEACHNWVTGKLSDFAGLFIFPLFWTALFPQRKHAVFWLTACGFVYWKSPFSQPLIEAWNGLGVLRLARVVDYWDYLALAVLPVAFGYEKRRDRRLCLRLYPQVPLVISSIAFLATSESKPGPERKGPTFVFSDAYQVRHVSRDSLIHQLNHSDLPVDYVHYPNAGYWDQYAVLDYLNDSIRHIHFMIGDFDPETQTVQVKLEEIVYGNDGPYAGGYDEQRDTIQTKRQLKELFENQVLKRISKNDPKQ